MDKEAIERILAEVARPTLTTIGDGRIPHALLPPGWRYQSFDALAAAPPRINEHKTFRTIDSLIDYSRMFVGKESVIFSQMGAGLITVHMDYHTKAESHWNLHTASIQCLHPAATNDWLSANGSWLSHKAFARLIDDHCDNLVDMDGKDGTKRIDMLEVSRTLSVAQEIDVKSAHSLSDGSSQMTCNVTNRGTSGSSNVLIPKQFGLVVKPYSCADVFYDLVAKFEYRVKEGEVNMRYELVKLDDMLSKAFSDVGNRVRDRLALPLFEQP